MRKGALLVAAAVAVFALGSSAATSATPAKRYFELSVDASFYSETDYGRDEARTWTGAYSYRASFHLRAVAVYEGKRLGIPSRGAFVAAEVEVVDSRMKLEYPSKTRVPFCPGWGGDKYTQGVDTNPKPGFARPLFVPARAGVALRGGDLRVDPGVPIKWILGCGVTDFLHQHGLQAGPGVSVPAPTLARLAAGKRSALTCVDRASHDASHPHRVEYEGEVAIRVRFAPIAESRLDNRVQTLRGLAGQAPSNPFVLAGNDGKPCL